jgi:hypothetical protein
LDDKIKDALLREKKIDKIGKCRARGIGVCPNTKNVVMHACACILICSACLGNGATMRALNECPNCFKDLSVIKGGFTVHF